MDPTSWEEPDEELVVVVQGKTRKLCPLPLRASCTGRLSVEQRGHMLLACLPWAATSDGCLTSAVRIQWVRHCMLVDLGRSRCHALPMVDARLKQEGRLEVIQQFMTRVARLPQSFAELSQPWLLDCKGGATPARAVHPSWSWPSK